LSKSLAHSEGRARPIGLDGVFAAILGNSLEFFDFTVYATFVGAIGATFFPSASALTSDLAAAATFGVGFVARPIGGAILGAYADRAGRAPAMNLSIGLMAIGTAAIAVTPGYEKIGPWAPILLLIARLLQGFAVGGEVGPATVFLIEAAPVNRRMFYSSWQLASQNLGSLCSGLIGFLLAAALSKSSLADWGWRLPFALGILIAPVGLYMRSRLTDTLDDVARKRKMSAGEAISKVLLRNWRRLLLALALISGGTITQYFLHSLTPYAIRTLRMADSTAMLATVTLGVTGCLGALAGGLLADRYDVRVVATTPRIILTLALFPLMSVLVAHPSPLALVLTTSLLSAMQGMSGAVTILLIPPIFPQETRATSLAISYSLGVAIFGGTATYVVTWLVGVPR